MISYEDMIVLLEIKDGYDAIDEAICSIIGGILAPFGSPLAKIEKINGFIRKHSPLYVRERDYLTDYSDTEFYKVLESDLPNEEK
ncbi:MAG: hypothetical protein J5965_13690, partial [Aeriscardovia sp.]|nr:hypothetical protein [Aeriscardovia sp.]